MRPSADGYEPDELPTAPPRNISFDKSCYFINSTDVSVKCGAKIHTF
jgi:hypothetical protein